MRRKIIWLVLVIIIAVFSSQLVIGIYAQYRGDYISVKTIGRQGVGNSVYVIGSALQSRTSYVVMGPAISMPAAEPFIMDSNGTRVTLYGTIDNMNGFPNATIQWEWGYTPSLGNIVGASTVTAAGRYSYSLIHISPGQPVYYRFFVTTDGTNYTTSRTFVIQPSTAYTLVQLIPVIFMSTLIFVGIAALAMGASIPGLIILAISLVLGVAFMDTILGSIANLW